MKDAINYFLWTEINKNSLDLMIYTVRSPSMFQMEESS